MIVVAEVIFDEIRYDFTSHITSHTASIFLQYDIKDEACCIAPGH